MRQIGLYHREALLAEQAARADRIEETAAAIGAAFGDGKALAAELHKLRARGGPDHDKR